jgi:hypothetical protein
MRKMIYVPSPVIWDEITEAAHRQNRSVSNYLINLYVEFGRPKGIPFENIQNPIKEYEEKKVPAKEPEKTIITKGNHPKNLPEVDPYFKPQPKKGEK